ncbi:unnamed protein product [Leuciscus chuanchicus]
MFHIQVSQALCRPDDINRGTTEKARSFTSVQNQHLFLSQTQLQRGSAVRRTHRGVLYDHNRSTGTMTSAQLPAPYTHEHGPPRALGLGLWMVFCPSGPSGCGSVDPIVFCINTRGLVHKGHLVSSLNSTAGMKSSHHSPFAHICSVVRQGRGLSLGDWGTGVQFAP